MTASCEQFGALLARNDDGPAGWMQLLVFVVIAVIYVLGNLAKSRADKSLKEQEDEEDQPGEKPRYKPLTGFNLAEGLSQKREQQPKAQRRTILEPPEVQPVPQIRTEPETRRFGAEERDAGFVKGAPARAVKKRPLVAKTPAKPHKLKRTGRTIIDGAVTGVLTASKEGQKKTAVTREKPAEFSLELTDPEQLRAAILHYEILGKPVSLREDIR